MKKTIFALAIAGLLMACKQDDSSGLSQPLVLKYNQTNCADVWATDSTTDSATLRSFRAYLDKQHLYHSNEQLRAERTPALCNSCSCLTGKVFYVTVFPEDAQQLVAIGFYR